MQASPEGIRLGVACAHLKFSTLSHFTGNCKRFLRRLNASVLQNTSRDKNAAKKHTNMMGSSHTISASATMARGRISIHDCSFPYRAEVVARLG